MNYMTENSDLFLTLVLRIRTLPGQQAVRFFVMSLNILPGSVLPFYNLKVIIKLGDSDQLLQERIDEKNIVQIIKSLFILFGYLQTVNKLLIFKDNPFAMRHCIIELSRKKKLQL